MIFESWYWKRELVELLTCFEAWSPKHITGFKTEDWYSENGFQLERSLFYSALIIRRLIDSNKITDQLRGKSIQLNTLRSLKEAPHTTLSLLGSVDILKHFDFESPKTEHFSPYTIASEIVHSFTLEFIANDSEDDLDSILVASEKNQFLRAVKIPKPVWVALLNDFINDQVSELRVSRTSMESNPKIELK